MMERIAWYDHVWDYERYLYTFDSRSGTKHVLGTRLLGFDQLTKNVYTTKWSTWSKWFLDGDLSVNTFPDLTPIGSLVANPYRLDSGAPRTWPFLTISVSDPKQGVYAVSNMKNTNSTNERCGWDIHFLNLESRSVVKKVSLPADHCLAHKQSQFLDTRNGRSSDYSPFVDGSDGDNTKWILDSSNDLLFMQDKILDLKTDTILKTFSSCWSLKVNTRGSSGLCLNPVFKDPSVPYKDDNVKSVTVDLFDFKNRIVVNSVTIPQDKVDYILNPKQQFFVDDSVAVLGWEAAVTVVLLK